MVTQERARPGVRLTARGAIALIFVITLASEVTGSTFIVGLVFTVACLAAVLLVQPRDLLSLVVAPPLIFFVATLISAVIGVFGAPSLIQALGLGMFTNLSAAAPWLFGGSALVLAIAWFRGLPANIGELRADLRASRPAADTRRRQPGDEQHFVPEPEGYFEPRTYGSAREQKD
ncbi:hypothetical protein GCM10022226_70660 [Sphaerisporangium flaviroseum]|uniref:DUF6542 domain-containing protein n=1 Tax=Sphaerisporangium flaviroseum TaxID=509199 RepID=A0ABP7J9G4_9ACTN